MVTQRLIKIITGYQSQELRKLGFQKRKLCRSLLSLQIGHIILGWIGFQVDKLNLKGSEIERCSGSDKKWIIL